MRRPPSHKRHLRTGLGAFVCATFVALAVMARAPASAEVKVSGTAESVVVEAQREKLQSVLDKIGTTYAVSIDSRVPIEATINGTYRGSITNVLGRLLGDYNHTMRKSAGKLSLIVLGLKKSPAAAPSAPVVERLDPPPTTASIQSAAPATKPETRQAPPGTPKLSPEGRTLARKIFGPDAPEPRVSDEQLKAYARRGMARRGALNGGFFTGLPGAPPP